MSSKTKIVVLHMKEIIYTGIFLALGVLLLIFLIILFMPGKEDTILAEPTTSPVANDSATPDVSVTSDSVYIPGIYNTEVVLNDQTINVEVIVDHNRITSIELVNLSEAVTTMYPLLEPAFNSLKVQILENQTTDDITYIQESKYTSLVLLEAIRKSLDKACP